MHAIVMDVSNNILIIRVLIANKCNRHYGLNIYTKYMNYDNVIVLWYTIYKCMHAIFMGVSNLFNNNNNDNIYVY